MSCTVGEVGNPQETSIGSLLGDAALHAVSLVMPATSTAALTLYDKGWAELKTAVMELKRDVSALSKQGVLAAALDMSTAWCSSLSNGRARRSRPPGQLAGPTAGSVCLNEIVVGWVRGTLERSGDYQAGSYIVGRIDGIYLKPTAKSAFPKEVWSLKAKGDVVVRLAAFTPHDGDGAECDVLTATSFTRHHSERYFLNVHLSQFVAKVELPEGPGLIFSLPADLMARLREGQSAMKQSDQQALTAQRDARAQVQALKAQARREGSIDKMQKADLTTRIVQVFGELPNRWGPNSSATSSEPSLPPSSPAFSSSCRRVLRCSTLALCTKHSSA
eukprot:6631818-Prymnesium_polylepis.1